VLNPIRSGNIITLLAQFVKLDDGFVVSLQSLMHLDLMDFSSVRKFCDQVKSEYGTVDILVNNAGIFDTSGKLRRTEGGIEQHLVVNYLSQFLLTHLLLDTMKGGNPKNGRTKSPSR